MRMNIRSLLIPAVIILTASCAGVQKGESSRAGFQAGSSPQVKALSLKIPSPVKAGKPYPAYIVCTMPPAGIEGVIGYFFWNGEGPFEYHVSGSELATNLRFGRCMVFRFNLFTGRPSTYSITGYITYRDSATGAGGQTNIVSAGAVTVRQ